jgi:hypothetical protein
MVLLRSSGAFGGMHVKLTNGLTRHNWLANALIGDGLHWENRIDPRRRALRQDSAFRSDHSPPFSYWVVNLPARLGVDDILHSLRRNTKLISRNSLFIRSLSNLDTAKTA